MSKNDINIETRQHLETVLSYYHDDIENSSISALGNGLINQTYLVKTPDREFVLQSINRYVFKQPEWVCQNADLINQHLLTKQQKGEYPLLTINQLPNSNQQSFMQVGKGFYRALAFVPNSYSIDNVQTPQQAEKVAWAFAQFNAALSDFPAQQLVEIIPHFHSLAHRLTQLKEAITSDKVNRKAACIDLIDDCFAQQAFIDEVAKLLPILPLKVTHNDTKINNLLFSADTHEVLAVIDLDTCMPGVLMHDFGDMVRTCCSNLSEDGTALQQMKLKLDIFKALANSYINSLDKQITLIEKDSLIVGALLLPFLMGVRFLTDYLDGDNYFHVQRPLHNLERAKNQLQLFKLLAAHRQELAEIIKQTP
ncbi:phosphotransferase enzyme family protein [Glaciecola sp. SC05]|uniref:phosphotransferase enzyme family protein n=1 Tax=Glaciecola sp. SC05 TaxID=1987355 RepID=UPI0035284B87